MPVPCDGVDAAESQWSCRLEPRWETLSVDIHEAMAVGQARYADALAELDRFGPAVFTQTGGMCGALQLTLERGYLLITDAEDSLPWSRDHLQSWGVGYYPSEDASEGPEVFVAGEETTAAALGVLVEQCLREAAAALRAWPPIVGSD